MAYNRIVFIGYVIDTAPKDNGDGTSTYLGLPVAGEDVAARCQLMLSAMQKARSMIVPEPGALHVFVIPEFFMRGATGAYELDVVQTAIATLQRLVNAADWEHWVFAFGTIIGRWRDESAAPPVQICNFALTQRGGIASAGPDYARVVVKELKSGIDFIAAGANPGGLLLGAVDHPEAAPPGPGRERQKTNYDGAGIFDLAGLTWAVEICLDHAEGRLLRSPQLPGSSMVQVQLIPSCGMSIQGGVVGPGGYVFNVDGYRASSHADLVQATAPDPMWIVPAAEAPLGIDAVTLPDSPPRRIAIDQLYAGGSGKICVFPAVAVPTAATVPGSMDLYTWPACSAPSWVFTFLLVYDAWDQCTAVLVEIVSSVMSFDYNRYTIPLRMFPLLPKPSGERIQRYGKIDLSLMPPAGEHDFLVYGDIDVPGFRFQGAILQFKRRRGTAVVTIWPSDIVPQTGTPA